jgi:hypothetical protein
VPLGLIYIFLTAKPFSIRRLCVLFIVVLMFATLLGVLHPKHAFSDGLGIATSVALLAWIFPLACVIHNSLRYRRLALEALDPVSDVVRWTYGCAFAAVPVIAIGCLLGATHHLVFSLLPRLMTTAGLGSFALLMGASGGKRAPRGLGSSLQGCSPRTYFIC